MLDNNQTQEMVEIPHEYLIEGVKQAVEDVKVMLARARAKHGDRYNERNDYETFGRRFGYNDPEKIWAEFMLVFNKQSREPAAVRHVIKDLGSRARYYAIRRMQQNPSAGSGTNSGTAKK